MRDSIVAGLLTLSLTWTGPDHPPEWFFDALGHTPKSALKLWEEKLIRRGWYLPDVEVIDYHRAHVTGVYWVIWNRAKGHPLPYPTDWVYGWGKP